MHRIYSEKKNLSSDFFFDIGKNSEKKKLKFSKMSKISMSKISIIFFDVENNHRPQLRSKNNKNVKGSDKIDSGTVVGVNYSDPP